MQTQQIVRGSAEVLTITRLAVNDVYKRVVETSYSTEPTLRYGVVTDVMDNGPDAAVVALEFRPADYSGGVQIETKIITGSQQIAIFPATPDEVGEHMAKILEAAHAAESTASDALDKATAMVAKVLRTSERLGQNLLTAPATSATPLPPMSDDDDETPQPADPGF